ncbi:hypothetical protein ACFLW6_04140, partial [Chloroflexota bacterium]
LTSRKSFLMATLLPTSCFQQVKTYIISAFVPSASIVSPYTLGLLKPWDHDIVKSSTSVKPIQA